MKRSVGFAVASLAGIILVVSGLSFILHSAQARSQTSVVRVTGADENLQKAAKTAQATLPKFLERLHHPQAGDKFAVKVKFQTRVGPEYLWVKEPKAQDAQFSGTLDQNPIALAHHRGDQVKFSQAQIYDWLIRRKDGSMAGGFTEIALDGS